LELILNFIDAYTDSNLAVITMQQSSKGNRLNKKNLEDLYQAIYTSIKDPEVRALLLRSNGSRFCLGMDLNYLQDVRKDKKRIEKAIELYTLGAAYAEFMEDRKGKLKEGYLADIVIFNNDLMTIPHDQIMTSKVDYTIVGGKIVFKRDIS